MHFIRVNAETLNRGGAVFNDYLRYTVCGKSDGEGYQKGMKRRGGVSAVPGAVLACLNSGILDFYAVVCGVSRATRCKRSTVEAFFSEVLDINSDLDQFDEAAAERIEDQILAANTLIAA